MASNEKHFLSLFIFQTINQFICPLSDILFQYNLFHIILFCGLDRIISTKNLKRVGMEVHAI
uniref:F-box/LRR-repeat protein 13-like isoform X2 n=1 Tax=Rhizophora mucronata TaxID=61149 RepID=A0A2P2MD66_RHIMU